MTPSRTVVLVVANETLAGDELIDAVRRRPRRARSGWSWSPPSTSRAPATSSTRTRAARPPAAARPPLAALHAGGHPGARRRVRRRAARRRQGHARAGARRRADRLHPSRGEVRLAAPQPARRDPQGCRRPAGRARRRGVERASGSATCSSSRTRPCSASRCSTASAPAPREGPASFLIVCPQSDPQRRRRIPRPSGVCARRSRAARGGIDAHGQIAHPDPYTAAMQAIHDERIDEMIVSTFPGERSGWLRRDLVGRLRADAERAGRARRRRPGPERSPHDARTPRPLHGDAHEHHGPPPAQPELAARLRRCSACSSSSPRRRCCSARSSPPTSSSASSTRDAPAEPGRLRRTSSRCSSPASTQRSSSRRASRCTGRCSRSGATTGAGSRRGSCSRS